MLTQHIAIVPAADTIRPSELASVSAAIQKQVTRDLSPIWSLRATVDAFPTLEDVPVGYWPVFVGVDDEVRDGAVYLDERGQPYGRVSATPGSTRWSLAASRVCLELLVNPTGDRAVSAPSLRSDQGLVEYLVDVWGPCADAGHSYFVNEVLVSDFCTPAFFGHVAGGGIDRCSFRGTVPLPLQVPRGGHLAWYEPRTQAFWVRNHWEDNPVDLEWDASDRRGTAVREWIRTERGKRTPVAPPPLPERSAFATRRPVRGSAVRSGRSEPLRTLPEPFGDAASPGDSEPAEPTTLVAAVGASVPDAEDRSESETLAPPAPAASNPEAVTTVSAANAHPSFAPVAIVAPSPPPSVSRHGLSLLGGALAGALLVVFLLGRQDPSPRAATSGGPNSMPPAPSLGVVKVAPAEPAVPRAPVAADTSLARELSAPVVPKVSKVSRPRKLVPPLAHRSEPASVEPAKSADAVTREAPPSANTFDSLVDTRE